MVYGLSWALIHLRASHMLYLPARDLASLLQLYSTPAAPVLCPRDPLLREMLEDGTLADASTHSSLPRRINTTLLLPDKLPTSSTIPFSSPPHNFSLVLFSTSYSVTLTRP